MGEGEGICGSGGDGGEGWGGGGLVISRDEYRVGKVGR